MSIVEPGNAALDPKLVMWTGYLATVAGVVMAVVSGIWPDPIKATAAIALAIVPIAAALYAPQVFEVAGRNGKRGFNPVLGAPAVALFCGTIDLHIIDVLLPWIAALAGAAICGLLAWAVTRRHVLAAPLGLTVSMVITGAALGAGVVNVVDARFDGSAPESYRVTISGMHETHGKGTSYYLELPPWGPVASADSVSVSHEMYNQLFPGAQVCMTLHRGALGLRWYKVGGCPDGAKLALPPMLGGGTGGLAPGGAGVGN